MHLFVEICAASNKRLS